MFTFGGLHVQHVLIGMHVHVGSLLESSVVQSVVVY